MAFAFAGVSGVSVRTRGSVTASVVAARPGAFAVTPRYGYVRICGCLFTRVLWQGGWRSEVVEMSLLLWACLGVPASFSFASSTALTLYHFMISAPFCVCDTPFALLMYWVL